MPTRKPTRTDIDLASNFYFCRSPIFLNYNYTGITSVVVHLWMWSGAQNQDLGEPTLTLAKNVVSADDNYITINIASNLEAFLIGKNNQPNIAWNQITEPAMTGQAMFWQIISYVYQGDIETLVESVTNVVTLGNRWNYEQRASGNNGILPYGSFVFPATPIKNYNPKIANYTDLSFDLTTTVATATTDNIILKTPSTLSNLKCTPNPFAIIYLNKLGLWEVFTPLGKVKISSTISGTTSERGFRNPSTIDNSYIHSKIRSGLNVTQSYLLNTGLIDETNVQCVEEIVTSPKVYLLNFKGDTYTAPQVGITVDSTYITVDDTIITVDSSTVTNEDVGFYDTFIQVPVIVTDTDFFRKTRLNDKTSIDYFIKFDETNNKINNIQ